MSNEFEDLQAWDLLIESKQYRSTASTGRMNLRNVSDFAFLDMIALFILNHEYESAPIASTYADKTISYRNFIKPRLSGTDLYVSLNILSNPNSAFSQRIHQNPEADAILRSKLNINLPTMKRYLDLVADSKISTEDASTLFLRMEKQLNITDSKLKSIRRLAQDWPNLNSMQRELVVTRMLQFYHRYARQSEMAVFLDDLAKTHGYQINPHSEQDAELTNLGYGVSKKKGWIANIAPLAALIGGYKAFGPKNH
jgi:hypothetical protein